MPGFGLQCEAKSIPSARTFGRIPPRLPRRSEAKTGLIIDAAAFSPPLFMFKGCAKTTVHHLSCFQKATFALKNGIRESDRDTAKLSVCCPPFGIFGCLESWRPNGWIMNV